jgi:hypothetical protein
MPLRKKHLRKRAHSNAGNTHQMISLLKYWFHGQTFPHCKSNPRNGKNECRVAPTLLLRYFAARNERHTEDHLLKKVVSLISVVFLLCGNSLNAASWPDNISRRDRAYLRQLMKDTWHYIDYYISPITGLPYDSNQAKDITNTTNIGLYLASLCMAYKLGYVEEAYAVARVTKILDSLDTYENWHRLYGNWIDPEGIVRTAKPRDSNISDYNKLPAGLIVVRQTFPQLAERCTAFLDEIPWEEFMEPGSDKIRYAFDVAQKKTLNPVYFYRGEDKILGHFLMIASGKVPPSTWNKHDLSMEELYGVKYYKWGWQGGGLFMQFICDLFMDNRGTPLGMSSANFAWAQMVHGLKIGAPVWGWSACVAPNGKYLGMNMLVDEVVTPHASALAVSLFPCEVADNLRRLETYGLRAPCMVDGKPEAFGFRDSVNWKTGQITDKYLVLDQAMLFLSLVNYCQNGLLWKTFCGDPMIINGRNLLAEYRAAPKKRAEQHARIRAFSWPEPGTFWMSDNPASIYSPNDVIQKTLWARSLCAEPLEGYSEKWVITDERGDLVADEPNAIELEPRQTKKIADVMVLTDRADFASTWSFDSVLSSSNQTLATRHTVVRFPNTLPLSGTWKIATGDDPARARIDFDDSSWKTATVPLRWEDDALPDYDGMAWYRVRFSVPAEALERWRGKPIAILLGAVDDADETFLNGQKIGQGGAFPPDEKTAWDVLRVYEFDGGLIQEENVLAVRVSDTMGNGGIWRGPVAIGPAEELRTLASP